MTTSQWVTYCLAVFLGGIIPGPVMLLALTSGARHGVLNALPAALGNILASIIQVLLSLWLYNMVTESSETFLRVMTGIGGLYLIYLAWDLWRTNPFANVALNAPQRHSVPLMDFINMFFLTMTNPKALMFFIALFPLIIPTSGYDFELIGLMTTVFALIAFLCFAVYASAGWLIKRTITGKAVAWVTSLCLSTAFLVFGIIGIARFMMS